MILPQSLGRSLASNPTWRVPPYKEGSIQSRITDDLKMHRTLVHDPLSLLMFPTTVQLVSSFVFTQFYPPVIQPPYLSMCSTLGGEAACGFTVECHCTLLSPNLSRAASLLQRTHRSYLQPLPEATSGTSM